MKGGEGAVTQICARDTTTMIALGIIIGFGFLWLAVGVMIHALPIIVLRPAT
jgi:hypothetical protein